MRVILFILFLSVSAYSQDEFRPWPDFVDEKTTFYRGQATSLTSVSTMLDMLLKPNDDSYVTSRLMRTFKTIYPHKSLNEISELIDKQIMWWKENDVIWKISECHVAVYGCSMPSVKELMGEIFELNDLPQFILDVYIRQLDNPIVYLDMSEMGMVLEFFDPVVSTSYFKDVADNFAKDKEGGFGYTMILNDKFNRNCEKKWKDLNRCFISIEEYYEEFEMPFWGYVKASEFDGFVVDDIAVKRENQNINISQSNINLVLDSNICQNLKLIDFNSKRKMLLNSELKKYFKCN